MITNNENAWGNEGNNQTQGYGSTSFGTPDNGDTTNRNFSDDINEDSGIDRNSLNDEEEGNIPGAYSSNESMSGTNSPDDDDDDLDLATGDDISEDDDDLLSTDDDDLLDDDDDLDADYDETKLDDTEGGGTNGAYTTGVNASAFNDPDEIPEERQSDNEGTGYTEQNEHPLHREGNDASYSEQIDVTPPDQHEFPSVGSPQTDFSSRDHGRTTGRMVGHEPGTEGI